MRRTLISAVALAASLWGATASAAPIELPQLWAGLSLGMSVGEFDEIACARPDCRDSLGAGARISYAINPAKARALEILPVSDVRFAIRWATFVRGRLVGFRAAPATQLPIAAREALTTDVWRWLGLPTEALNLLEWCGRAGE